MLRLLITIWAVLLLLPGAVQAQEPALHVAAGTRIDGDVTTVSRDILVEAGAEVLGDVTSLSGTITIEGIVHGDAVSYTGSVTIGAQGEVRGSVLSLAASTRVEGVVAGQQFNAPFGSNPAGQALELPAILNGTLIRGGLSFLLGLLLVLLGLASLLTWPNRMRGAALALQADPAGSALAGLLSTALLALLLAPLLLLLAISLIGLPLLVPLLVLFHLPYLLGLTVLARTLSGTSVPAHRPVSAVLLLLVVPLMLLGTVSLLAALVAFYLLGMAGLGAAVRSRGGSQLAVVRVRQ